MDADPTRIRSVAIHREDLLATLEATVRDRGQVVLRITPPFAPRERARIHRPLGDEYDDGEPAIHLEPASLIDEVPPFPTPPRTERELREREEPYDVERHHEYHAGRVADWRGTVHGAVRGRTTLPGTDHEVELKWLGDPTGD